MYGRCAEGVQKVHRRYVEGAQKVCGNCAGGVQKVHRRCTEGDGDKKNQDFMFMRF